MVIGYIIGIIWGLYFNFSIVPLYIAIVVIYEIYVKIKNKYYNNSFNKDSNTIYNQTQIRKFKLNSLKRYIRYFKLIFNQKVLFLIIISSIISNTVVIFQNNNYKKLYKDNEKIEGQVIIISNKIEKQSKYLYKVKVCNINENKKYKDSKLYIRVDKKYNFDYGDKIYIKGEFSKPNSQRNYGGFDYEQYLKTLKIYGTVNVDTSKFLSKNNCNYIFKISNAISLKIKQNIDKIADKENASILKGILLGDTSEIPEDIKEGFRISNISHILAISGMHISYIVIGINIIFSKVLGKRNSKIITITFLIIYMFLTNFTPSIARAGIMGILATLSGLVYRKNNIWNSIGISLLIIVLYNPFLITNVGLQLSYIGTAGIILFNKNILILFEKIKIKNPKIKYNAKLLLLISKLKEILSVIISAQLAIFPIMLFHFNVFGIYFFISNIFVSIIIGPMIIIGMIIMIISFINLKISQVIYIILSLNIKVLNFITNINNLPFSKIYVPTPKIISIIIYYILIILINFIYKIFNSKNPNNSMIRVKNLIALVKYKARENKKKIKDIIIILVFIMIMINIFPRKLEINFVDVGQGDCTFIVTPKNQTILIDGGGSLSKEFDVGKSTLLPYILDKGYTKIDYVIISHFDQDHVRTVCFM